MYCQVGCCRRSRTMLVSVRSDCAFFVTAFERSRRGLARREEARQNKGLAIMLVRATIASPPYHGEVSSWYLQAYQECTAVAILRSSCPASLNRLPPTG